MFIATLDGTFFKPKQFKNAMCQRKKWTKEKILENSLIRNLPKAQLRNLNGLSKEKRMFQSMNLGIWFILNHLRIWFILNNLGKLFHQEKKLSGNQVFSMTFWLTKIQCHFISFQKSLEKSTLRHELFRDLSKSKAHAKVLLPNSKPNILKILDPCIWLGI